MEVPLSAPPAEARLSLRPALRALSTVLIVAGALLLVDAGLTVAWQEPLSALYARLRQDSLASDLRALERSAPSALELGALTRLGDEQRRIAFLARALKRRAGAGSAVGRIRIPRIGADFVLVSGTDADALRNGPGLYPQTPFPGAPGTVAIAGHRTTYLAPFRRIDALSPGDTIAVEMPYARLVYRVQGRRIVDPTDVGVIRRAGYDRLVLTACHPLYSAAQRIVVFARLALTVPRGPAIETAPPRGLNFRPLT
ncbi:MAG TPA: class E sortase [Solirubrobacteraceae bacterium]|jgi:sortase A|nr:class E sortase [Solirubrobacteraceae bacterium]